MLSNSDLRDRIVSELNYSVQCITYLKSIKDYVEGDIEINAVYVGLTPTGTPDPKNGNIKLKLTITPDMVNGLIVKQFLSGLKSPDPNAFVNSLFSELIADVISGPTGYILTSKAIYSVIGLSNSDLDSLKKSESYQDAWLIICDSVIKSFLTLKSVPTPIPTTTSSGVGVTTISTVK